MINDILKQVKRLDVFTKNNINSLFLGNYRSAFRGRGIEFADIRPYAIGDDVRDIDWKTTSKQDEVFIKTYHESRDNTLFFVIDGTEAMYFSSEKKQKYELLLETFALIAFAAVQNGDRVGILFQGGKKSRIFPPKKGRRNVLKILKFCVEQYQNHKTSNNIETLEKEFHKLLALLKHSTTIFWMSGKMNIDSKEIQKSLKILKAKHDVVPMVFVDPMEENFDFRGEMVFEDSFSGKQKTIVMTEEVVKRYRKNYYVKKKNFQRFFQKNHMDTLFISHTEKIYQKLFMFFQTRQR